jgi:hypothetical protein
LGLGAAGGGSAKCSSCGTSGLANSGGGGGAGMSLGSNGFSGGAGGSGIVIIRYPINTAPPANVTGSPQILYNNGYQIYVWTSSGSITF